MIDDLLNELVELVQQESKLLYKHSYIMYAVVYANKQCKLLQTGYRYVIIVDDRHYSVALRHEHIARAIQYVCEVRKSLAQACRQLYGCSSDAAVALRHTTTQYLKLL